VLEETMTDKHYSNVDLEQKEQTNTDKNDMRAMWIASAVIVLIILGGMGINMLIHHDTSTDSMSATGQAQTAPSR
jgi:hypothetical protein